MSDQDADTLIQNGYDRWLRLEGEKDAISADLKELMAELKSRGLEPKPLRAAFRRRRDSEDQSKVDADAEFEAMVDLYLTALARDARKGRIAA
jgi:uncharacterized protein (UPF0335 family)